MPRISKDPETRKREIVAAAQALFIDRGFAETRISDIAKRLGVSQGVFYYYFNSKDDVIDEIVASYMSELIAESERATRALQDPLQRLAAMAKVQHRLNSRVNRHIHAIKGVDMHERIIRALVRDYVPLMQTALDGHHDTPETRYWLEVMVTAGNILFDPGLFGWTHEEHTIRVDHLIDMMEKTRGLPAGSFSFYRDLMGATDHAGASGASAPGSTAPEADTHGALSDPTPPAPKS